MANLNKIVAFLITTKPEAAKSFYQNILGLIFVQDEPFALVFDANGTMVRISKMQEFSPAGYTVLGWEVADIGKAVAELAAKGVSFERFPGMEQDERGIWASPGGSKVAWFKDPDGNVLSLSQNKQV